MRGVELAGQYFFDGFPGLPKNFGVSGIYEDPKLSARLVYTWRSEAMLFGASANPIEARHIAFSLALRYKFGQ